MRLPTEFRQAVEEIIEVEVTPLSFVNKPVTSALFNEKEVCELYRCWAIQPGISQELGNVAWLTSGDYRFR